jgi:hypothetical protein
MRRVGPAPWTNPRTDKHMIRSGYFVIGLGRQIALRRLDRILP